MDSKSSIDTVQIKDIAIPQEIIDRTMQIRHGTTTLAFIFNEGIVVAVDSKATAGAYVSSRSVNKVIEINPYLLGTMAGGAADCFFWQRILGAYAKEHELEYGSRLTATHASKYFADIMNRYSGQGLSVSTMICGYDGEEPHIFNVTSEGSRVKHNMFSVGSGSTIAKGILSQRYRFDMARDEALALGRDAIYAAGMRDAATGGIVNLYFMDSTGWQKVNSWELDELRKEKEQHQALHQ